LEFHIQMGGARPDVPRLDEALRNADPAAFVDLHGATLRVATSLGIAELRSVIALAGYPLPADQVMPQPSICCGGCSG
jgi:hypothetical protein